MAEAVAFIAFQVGTQANGGLQSLTEILRGTRTRRVVITQRESPFTEAWRALGCEVHVLSVPPPLPLQGAAHLAYTAARVPAVLRANFRIAHLIRACGARVVHCNDAAALWYGGLGARAAGASLVLNVRGTKESGETYGLKWKIIRHLAREIVVLSREMTNEIQRKVPPLVRFAPAAKTSFIYSAVDLAKMKPPTTDERAALRAELGVGEDVCAIGHIGIFNENKNQLRFLEHVAPRVLESSLRTEIIFIGDFDPERNEYAARCRSAVERLRLTERTRFVGFTKTPERWYRALDVICVTSRHEGLPRAMIEGLACGVPTVSFDIVSAREILEGHGCGRVLEQGDYDGFAEVLRALVQDPAERRALGRRGATIARELFDPAVCVDAYDSLYRRLAGD